MNLSGKVIILVPVHNRREITRRFIRCLKYQTFQNFHLVVIDDGSCDGTADMVREELPAATILSGNGDLWWGGSLHCGYEWVSRQALADEDVVLIINDDVSFGPEFLQMGKSVLDANPRSAVGSRYFDQSSGEILDRGATCDFSSRKIWPASSDNDLVFLSTRGLFLTAYDFVRSGGFVPDRLPHYLSDYEFTFRLRNEFGLQLLTDDRVSVFGLNDQSGQGSVAGLGVWEALKTIFSKRFHANPVYYSNFISLCFPEKYRTKFIIKAWREAVWFWVHSWPRPIRVFAKAFRRIFRGIVWMTSGRWVPRLNHLAKMRSPQRIERPLPSMPVDRLRYILAFESPSIIPRDWMPANDCEPAACFDQCADFPVVQLEAAIWEWKCRHPLRVQNIAVVGGILPKFQNWALSQDKNVRLWTLPYSEVANQWGNLGPFDILVILPGVKHWLSYEVLLEKMLAQQTIQFLFIHRLLVVDMPKGMFGICQSAEGVSSTYKALPVEWTSEPERLGYNKIYYEMSASQMYKMVGYKLSEMEFFGRRKQSEEI